MRSIFPPNPTHPSCIPVRVLRTGIPRGKDKKRIAGHMEHQDSMGQKGREVLKCGAGGGAGEAGCGWNSSGGMEGPGVLVICPQASDNVGAPG